MCGYYCQNCGIFIAEEDLGISRNWNFDNSNVLFEYTCPMCLEIIKEENQE